MNTNNMKRIALTAIASCMLSFAVPVACTANQQKSWSKWAKIGAVATVVAGVCAWLYLDTRAQSLLKMATTSSQKQFVEDLKHHAAFNANGTPRDVFSAATSYMSAPEAEVLKNTTTSLNALNTDFKAELFTYQIGSKLCAVATALGFYGLMQPVQEEEQVV